MGSAFINHKFSAASAADVENGIKEGTVSELRIGGTTITEPLQHVIESAREAHVPVVPTPAIRPAYESLCKRLDKEKKP